MNNRQTYSMYVQHCMETETTPMEYKLWAYEMSASLMKEWDDQSFDITPQSFMICSKCNLYGATCTQSNCENS